MRAAGVSRILAAAMLVGVLAVGAAGDTVKLTSGLKYDNVTVSGVTDGMLEFRMVSGRKLAKPLGDVAKVVIVGWDAFNQAEDLFAAGKTAEAVKAYDSASQSAQGWRKVLIRGRLLPLYQAAGQIDQAVRIWLDIVDDAGGAMEALAARPKTLAPKGSAANSAAINLLKAKAGEVEGPYLKSVQTLLVDLYERQGRLSEAQALMAKLGGTPRPPAGNGKTPTTVGAKTSIKILLRQASLAQKAGDHAKAVKLLGVAALRRCSAAELPTAMYLLAGSQLELAKAASDPKAGRSLLLRSGLNFMRVAVNFPASPEAADALLGAGKVNERLGNFAAAGAAYSTVIAAYPDTPVAAKAKAAREQIKDK